MFPIYIIFLGTFLGTWEQVGYSLQLFIVHLVEGSPFISRVLPGGLASKGNAILNLQRLTKF